MTGKDRLDYVIRTLRQHAAEFRAQGVVHMAVFGSVARGEAGADSDVDLVVAIDPDQPPSLLQVIRLEQDAAQLLDSAVDLSTWGELRPRVAAEARAHAVNVF